MYELRYLRWWVTGGALLLLLSVLASLVPGSQAPATHGADKLGHALMYGSVFLWFSGILKPRRWWFLLLFLLALGGVMELLQARVPGRSRDLWDLVANGVGLVTGLLLAYAFTGGWCRRIENRRAGARAKS